MNAHVGGVARRADMTPASRFVAALTVTLGLATASWIVAIRQWNRWLVLRLISSHNCALS